jgi:hypothetical protein
MHFWTLHNGQVQNSGSRKLGRRPLALLFMITLSRSPARIGLLYGFTLDYETPLRMGKEA